MKELELRKQEEEFNLKKLIGDLDRKIQGFKDDKEIEDLKIREKEHEVKITELKIKEVKR